MATQPTNLPVPSESPRDLKFNAGKIDEFVSSFFHTYTDRFGSDHYTIEGLRWLAQQAIVAFGYITIDSFQEGATLTLPNQVLRWKLPDGDGDYYRWDGSFGSTGKEVPAGSTPETTGGVGKGAWVSVGYAAAINNLLSAQPGASNILGLMLKFTPVAYGALANATDDTAAFTACMAAMPSGATMDLQGLTYSVTDIEVTKPMRIINGTINVLYGSVKGGVYVHDTNNVHVQNVTTIVDYANKASYTAPNVSGIHFENCTDISVVNCTAIGSKNDSYLATGSWGCPIHAYQCSRISFQNCVVKNGDKEGLMTRFCDEVWMNNCRGYECGQSCIGTSGGNKAIINACYSYKAGNTGITMNNQNSSVTNCVVEGNLLFAGIVIGHSHETQAYANNCLISGNVIVGAAYNGIMVTYGRNVTVTGNSIENAGSVSTGNGILIDRSSTNNSVFSVTGNSVRLATGTGIFFVDEPGKESHVTITGNNIFSVTLQGIRVDNDGYSKVSGNKLRGIGTTGIQMYPATLDGTRRAKNFYAENNTIEFCGLNGITTAGAELVKVTDNSVLGFNGTNNANATGYRHLSTLDNVIFYELPSLMEIGNNIFTGTVGTTINCVVSSQPDGLATTGKVLKVENNHFSIAGSVVPVGYSNTRQNLFYDGNTRGTDATLVTASIPSSGSVVVSNSNITAFSLPNIVARGNSGFYVSSWSLGTMTLANTSATSINVTINF